MGKTAIVIGATGLVGSSLVNQLLADNDFSKVVVFLRRSLKLNNPKLVEYVIDFEQIEKYSDKIKGDVIFSSLGTTIKKAKTKENQYRIDYTYQYNFAKIASDNKVGAYALVSSGGANSKSKNFYLQMKGKLDVEVRKLPFRSIYIFKPSVLVGDRGEFRFGEKVGVMAGKFLTLIPGLQKYKPIEGEKVAKAMVNVFKMKLPSAEVEYKHIFDFAK